MEEGEFGGEYRRDGSLPLVKLLPDSGSRADAPGPCHGEGLSTAIGIYLDGLR